MNDTVKFPHRSVVGVKQLSKESRKGVASENERRWSWIIGGGGGVVVVVVVEEERENAVLECGNMARGGDSGN
ncbi:hypothetical protein TanjilG_11303 [Lupinus angustifolius]|uniref:Uncharacterized protein n=1 Tax=Lupinus angustifolius TaxID=3871 RepID=A0A1J7I545_LUPAN|nr:hypothetical protein TanjilG_11303 [Lupinus angustifolius]